jgi:flagellar biosynthesis component FlhA
MKDAIVIEVGLALIPVIGTGSLLKEKVEQLRKEMLEKTGKKLPLIHVYDQPSLEPYNAFRILINNEERKKEELMIKKEEKELRFTNTLDVLVNKLNEVIQTESV